MSNFGSSLARPTQQSRGASAASSDVIERRTHVVVLFVDLSDSTRLSGSMEAETFAILLDEVKLICRRAVESRQGVINQFQGDGMLAVFGYPSPAEHDGRRAAEAALEIHMGVLALGSNLGAAYAPGLTVHSGLHSGLALVRNGDDTSGHIELFGPVAGLAKHLSDLAEADELLASLEALGPHLRFFDHGPVRRVELKSRAEPLTVCRILSRREIVLREHAPEVRGMAPLAGREIELATLSMWLQSSLAGTTVIGGVLGPAGQGKTRLVESFLAHSSTKGFRVLQGRGDAERTSVPLAPVLQILRTLLDVVPNDSDERVQVRVASVLTSLGLGDADALLLQQALALDLRANSAIPVFGDDAGGALRRVLDATARVKPVVLFIDDWHLTDDATRNWVHGLVHGGGPGLLVIVAARPDEAPDLGVRGYPTLNLVPLNDDAARASVRFLLPRADPFLEGRIVELCGGNPLYIEELCHFVRLTHTGDVLLESVRGPAWLEGLISARISRLDTAARQALDCAAAIGTQVPGALLEKACGYDPDSAAVSALIEADLLSRSGEGRTLQFKHGLAREVAYSSIGLEARRALHAKLAALLCDQGHAGAFELLAYHFAGAGQHVEAARHAALAGDRALSMSAIDRAKLYYRSALVATERAGLTSTTYPAWRSVLRRHGLACVFDPATADVAVFERAVMYGRRWGDLRGVAYAAYWLAYLHYALGAMHAAVEACAVASEACDGAGEPDLALQVMALLGQAHAAQGKVLALTVLDEVTARAARAPRVGARQVAPGVGYALACRASAIADRLGLESALPAFAQALAEVPAAGHELESSVLCLKSNALLWYGHWDEAAQAAQAAMQVATGVRSLYLLAMSKSLKAWADWQRCREPVALDELEAATQWLNASGKRLFVSLNHGRLAQAYAQTGRVDKARHHAALALRRLRQGDPFGAPGAWRALALLAWHRGRPALALRRLARADEAAAARGAGHESELNARYRLDWGLG